MAVGETKKNAVPFSYFQLVSLLLFVMDEASFDKLLRHQIEVAPPVQLTVEFDDLESNNRTETYHIIFSLAEN